ncbi:cytochrome B561 [Luminiphilus syltensis NOR5-1B]|uniref:Cytochrome B561 n=1 Tax=Luminiphilus syltensis NOR5-1B TaxID=565045 RepID=B8KRI5_9GAMM|nr:cytochrome b/b6 domain-containing protein [Luminiphilus syltensis]EED34291.1 cytochrome B561 [Luminiphilus syltensis NOR5-1B]
MIDRDQPLDDSALTEHEQGAGYPVWDLAVRVIHWSLALAVIGSWITAEQGWMDWHSRFGYGILILAITRVLWGVIGSYHARFSTFVVGPRTFFAYFRSPWQSTGHSPSGGYATLALLGLILLQAGSGMMSSDDILFEGPLAYWAGDFSDSAGQWHEVNWLLLQAMVVLHVGAVLYYQRWRKQPLIQAMWWGKAPDKTSDHPPKPLWRAVVAGAVVGLMLYAIVEMAPEAPSFY